MLVIRKATAADAALLTAMIRELAEFEHELDQVDITSEDLLRDGFRSSPCFHALIAEWGGQTAAYALYFYLFDLGRAPQLICRRSLRSERVSSQGDWEGAVEAHGSYCPRAELLRDALGGTQLEHVGHRFLPFPWSHITERVVSCAPHGGSL
jgi:hypothetical protein